MNIHFRWANGEQTLLLLTLEEGWTWAEYHDVVRQLATMIRQLDYTVDAVVEITSRVPFPSGSALSQLRQVARILPENIGVIVVVSPNPFVKTINNILIQMTPKLRQMVELADTREEAHAVVAARRAAARGQ
jgi:hypothetical protein